MRKYFSPEVEEKLNQLLGKFFAANSVADNIAYALDCELECPNASVFYHTNFAHAFTGDEFADGLSNFMTMNNMRPVRLAVPQNGKELGSIKEAFTETVLLMEELKKTIEDLIEELDYEAANKTVIVYLEDLLLKTAKYLKIANKWLDKAVSYEKANSLYKFDTDFEEFVHF